MQMLTRELAGASAKPIILSILASGESYGYAILQRIEELSDGKLTWEDSTLYPVLHRMENEGLLSSSWRRADNGRRRKYYRLTAKGQEVLETEKRQWLRVDAVLAQLWGLQPRLT
ncbi:MAG TPA: helix-turn-helix transcriptional regulator [Rhodothermales bacterium]|nr:helix-turn-helix transcriptional regulator [Rhodothermales bacterium]